MRNLSDRQRRVLVPLALLIAAPAIAVGCLDGPLARLNPHDEGMQVTLHLIGGADTARAEGEVLVFQLVTDPVLTGYAITWTSSAPTLLTSVGSGVFEVGPLRATQATVAVDASVGSRTVTRQVVILAAP
jgi:hypothetical protein